VPNCAAEFETRVRRRPECYFIRAGASQTLRCVVVESLAELLPRREPAENSCHIMSLAAQWFGSIGNSCDQETFAEIQFGASLE
jgi:hypothetical protein